LLDRRMADRDKKIFVRGAMDSLMCPGNRTAGDWPAMLQRRGF